ncbi:MAG: hypothetical protein ACI9Y1_000468 [Lentisphaeria bacterium]|jgi:hypothetical protein
MQHQNEHVEPAYKFGFILIAIFVFEVLIANYVI